MKLNYSEQNGAALVTALLVILLTTLLGIAIHSMATTSFTISINERNNTEAFYIADAGIAHATALIAKVQGSKYSTMLQTGANSAPDTGDELSSPPVAGLWSQSESIPAGSFDGGGITGFGANGEGRYFVSVRNDTAPGETTNTDSNGILIVTSNGIGRDGANATIEITIYNPSVSYPSFLADGDIKLNGDLKVLGPNGIIQVNGNTDNNQNNGLVCAEKKISITKNIVNNNNLWTTANCNVNPTAGNTLITKPLPPPIIDIPTLRSEFKPKANFVFKAGNIYRQTNGVESSFPLSNLEKITYGFDKWNWNNSKKLWTYTDNNGIMYNGTYYFEYSIAVSTTFKSLFPPKVTFLSEGSIDISKLPDIQPHLPGYALVSCNDLVLGLKIDINTNPGMIYAYGQIEILGKTEIWGSVIAANFRLPDGTNGPDVSDPGGYNLVSRSNRGTIFFQNPLTIKTVPDFHKGGLGITPSGWREIRY